MKIRRAMPHVLYSVALLVFVAGIILEHEPTSTTGFVLLMLWLFGIHPWEHES